MDYTDEARRLVRCAMVTQRAGYRAVAERMTQDGVPVSEAALRLTTSRGSITLARALAALAVMGLTLRVVLKEGTDDAHSDVRTGSAKTPRSAGRG